MDTITRINGNGQPYTTDLPKIVYLTKHINDVALAHIKENTGLDFTVGGWSNYEAQPTESWQLAALIMTYNFKTQYHNNASNGNTLFLKSDHHVGFDVESICPDCANHNGIRFANELESDRLAC